MAKKEAYRNVTNDERQTIIRLLKGTDLSFPAIGRRVGRDKSTISAINKASGARPIKKYVPSGRKGRYWEEF